MFVVISRIKSRIDDQQIIAPSCTIHMHSYEISVNFELIYCLFREPERLFKDYHSINTKEYAGITSKYGAGVGIYFWYNKKSKFKK